jgi:hypothetical protein
MNTDSLARPRKANPPQIYRPPSTYRGAVQHYREMLAWWAQRGMPHELAEHIMQLLDSLPNDVADPPHHGRER